MKTSVALNGLHSSLTSVHCQGTAALLSEGPLERSMGEVTGIPEITIVLPCSLLLQ